MNDYQHLKSLTKLLNKSYEISGILRMTSNYKYLIQINNNIIFNDLHII